MKPTNHYPLNTKQLHILKLTYKFRFVTAPLMAQCIGLKSRHSMYEALERLVDQKYLGKRIDGNEGFTNRGARYYLAPKSFSILRDIGLNQQVLKSMYKNKSVEISFIDHGVDVLRAYISLRAIYNDDFNVFTKSELGNYDYFPEPKQDLYLHRINKPTDEPWDYLFEIFVSTPTFIIKKRLAAYVDHFDSDYWQEVTKTAYPVLLVACPNPRVENTIRLHLIKTLDNMGIDELNIYTTTIEALISSGGTKLIWSSVYDPKKLVSLLEPYSGL